VKFSDILCRTTKKDQRFTSSKSLVIFFCAPRILLLFTDDVESAKEYIIKKIEKMVLLYLFPF